MSKCILFFNMKSLRIDLANGDTYNFFVQNIGINLYAFTSSFTSNQGYRPVKCIDSPLQQYLFERFKQNAADRRAQRDARILYEQQIYLYHKCTGASKDGYCLVKGMYIGNISLNVAAT